MPLLALLAVACHPSLPALPELPAPVVAPAPAEVPPPPPAVEDLASARIGVTGDIMMHGMVQRSAKDADRIDADVSINHQGYDALFEHVRDLLGPLDLAFGNLETPIAPKTGTGVKSMVFNAPPVLLPALSSTGFDVVSFANNHVYDQGRKGLVESIEQLEASDLRFVGAGRTCAEARAARLVDVNGLKLAWIGSTDLYNDDQNKGPDEPCVATLGDGAWVLEEAARAKAAGADLVLLSVHWGVEYQTKPEPRHEALAHALIEGGVDAIVGHHPHVLQPIELFETADGRTGLVIYSLGNFISNQSAWYVPGMHAVAAGNPRDGVLVTFSAVRRRYNRGPEPIVRAEIADVRAIPLWSLNNTQKRAGDEPVVIRPIPTEARRAQLEAALADAPDERTRLLLTKELTEMERRQAQVASILGPALLPDATAELPPDEG